VLILGASDLAADVASFIELGSGLKLAGFVEGVDKSRAGDVLSGHPVYWHEDIADFTDDHLAIAAIGDPKRKILIDHVAKLGFQFAGYVHPSATVASDARLGSGSIIGPGAVLAAKSIIGEHAFLNRNCSIGHHTEIGDCSTIGPGVNIGGRSHIGAGTIVGIGATIVDRISLAADSFVAAGSVVTKSFKTQVKLAGVPARVVATG
jgi:sugar O-acyltransferase (sialic acid O-acetyltransferase NeuD family)